MSKGQKRKRSSPTILPMYSQNLVELLPPESDRGCVLVAAASIDHALGSLLKAFFEKAVAPDNETDLIESLLIKGKMPPLQSSYMRACVCRASGLITSGDAKALEHLRLLRNHFAHEAGPVTLSPEDVEAFRQHQSFDVFEHAHKAFDSVYEKALSESDAKQFSEPRRQFMTFASLFHGWIQSREYYLRDNRLSIGTIVTALDELARPGISGGRLAKDESN